MTIRSKLFVNVLSLAGFFLVILSVLYIGNVRIGDALQKGYFTDQIIIGVSDMNTITYDFLMNPGERAAEQWTLKHASLQNRIRSAAFAEEKEISIMNRIMKNHDDTALLFKQILEINRRKTQASPAAQARLGENSERIVSQLMARSQIMASDAYALNRASNQTIDRIRSQSFWFIAVAVVIMTAVAGIASFLLSRNITASIQALKKGTEIIAQGNLDQRIPVKGADEITDLSRAFNEMADRLNAFYGLLAREVKEKEEAQTALQEAHYDLERRVEERTSELKERTSQLEVANKELEDFTYTVSHDLRAPLRAIDGFSRMLVRDTGDRFDDEVKRKFSVIRKNVQKMGQLIDDLLAFSRLGRLTISQSFIDMGDLVIHAWKECSALHPGRRMELRIDTLPHALGDAALMKQVLANLLSNAVKFTQSREEALIEVGCKDEGDKNVYFVKDNGVGFDMRYYDKLFGVFQTLHGAQEHEGTGVGLAIVHRIITRHGGRVWAEGKVGEGATFYFTLPGKGEIAV